MSSPIPPPPPAGQLSPDQILANLGRDALTGNSGGVLADTAQGIATIPGATVLLDVAGDISGVINAGQSLVNQAEAAFADTFNIVSNNVFYFMLGLFGFFLCLFGIVMIFRNTDAGQSVESGVTKGVLFAVAPEAAAVSTVAAGATKGAKSTEKTITSGGSADAAPVKTDAVEKTA